MDKMIIFMGHADEETGDMPIQSPLKSITMADINKISKENKKSKLTIIVDTCGSGMCRD